MGPPSTKPKFELIFNRYARVIKYWAYRKQFVEGMEREDIHAHMLLELWKAYCYWDGVRPFLPLFNTFWANQRSNLNAQIDEWLVGLFDPDHLEETIAAMASCKPDDGRDDLRREASYRKLGQAEAKLKNYREALEAGAGPEVAKWIKEATQERDAAKMELDAIRPTGPPSVEEIRALLARIGDVVSRLAEATLEEKQEIYGALGLRLSYQPGAATVEATVMPMVRVGGGN